MGLARMIGYIAIGGTLLYMGNCAGERHERKKTENDMFKVGIAERGIPYLMNKQTNDTFFVNTYNTKPLVNDFSYNIGLLQQAINESGITYNTKNQTRSNSTPQGVMDLNSLLDKK
jgi:hypothetical protein